MSEITDVFDIVAGTVVLRVRAQAGAGRSAVVGRYGNAVKIRVAAPPVGGRANAALVDLLAKELGLQRSAIELVRGDKSADKRFRLGGLDPDAAEDAIDRLVAQAGRDAGPAPGRR
jgi:uncharacterized protein (TIGR00251 family)